jgi:alanine dehydrogenase
MPGAVPLTSTYALNNATLPYVKALANLGFKEALTRDEGLRSGLNVCNGELTIEAVAQEHNYKFKDPATILAAL